MACLCWALLLVLWVQGCLSCLVSDCPEGGKRSGYSSLRQCHSCGPDGSGQCVSTSICCGNSFGCYMGTPETIICEKENELSSPCEPKGDSCLSVSEGKCVSNSICCNQRSCAEDLACVIIGLPMRTSVEDLSTSGQDYKKSIQDRLKSKLLEVLLRQP
uniref:Vasopressin oxytocin n=1 Tax=Ophionotus victoriae TaxID=667017 RepID=A0A220W0B3_9ECHI|nr:vasopressin oxytocin precursor [Ophionotus victoriae]